jgi:hypothetical protein
MTDNDKAIVGLRNRIKDVQTTWCDDKMILRYLRARNFDLDKSEEMLRATLKWREEYKPELILEKDDAVQKVKSLKQMFNLGVSKQGEAICYIVPGANKNPTDVRIKYLVWSLETIITNMDPNSSGKMIWIMDMAQFGRDSLTDSYGKEVAQITLNILQNHYPERLLRFVVMDSPWYFNLFWYVVQVFIDPKTKEKILFVSDDKFKILSEYCTPENLDVKYGGKLMITDEMRTNWEQFLPDKLKDHLKK